VLERLLAGVSPAARRAVTIALIAIAWIGFLVAVIAGLVVGLVIIVIGFVACWLVVATFAGKKGDDDRQSEPLLRGSRLDDAVARAQAPGAQRNGIGRRPADTDDEDATDAVHLQL
jgi:hypothetical protein